MSQRQWIDAEPSAQPGGVIALTVIAEAALLVALLATETIALARKAAKARLAVWRKFLAIKPGTRCIDNHVTAAELIPQVILDCWRCIGGQRIPPTERRHAVLAIHDFEGGVFLPAHGPVVRK